MFARSVPQMLQYWTTTVYDEEMVIPGACFALELIAATRLAGLDSPPTQ
jgi:hypothetical protein